VLTYYAVIRLTFDPWAENWHAVCMCPGEHLHFTFINFCASTPFSVWDRSPYGMDGQTYEQNP